ncbi:MAG: flippase-like domain-containing protein [Prevotella sp.]|nr:flippase-like domain-containing protein [Prevotella sp.]
MGRWTRKQLNNLFFFIGVVAVVVMMLTFDVSFIELWQHLCHAGYWLLPIVGVWALVYALNALSWHAIVRSKSDAGQRVGFGRIYRLTISGYALNYATPVGGLGGEPYRIMELSKDVGKQQATSSVILYAMMHFFAHFGYWFTSIFIYLALAIAGNLPLNVPIATVLALMVVLCLAAFVVFARGYRKGLVVKGLRWAGHIPGLKGWSKRFSERHDEALHNIDRQIAALYADDKRTFCYSLLMEYLSRVVQSSEVMFMLLLFGIDGGGTPTGLLVTFLHSLLIVSFTSLFANLIGFLPMQLGVQEGGFVLSIAALGLSAALGIFVSIICRVREIIWIFIGLLLMRLPYSRP